MSHRDEEDMPRSPEPSPLDPGSRSGDVCILQCLPERSSDEFPSSRTVMPGNIGCARAAHHVNKPIGDHLLFFGVPFLALAVNVYTYAQTVFLGKRALERVNCPQQRWRLSLAGMIGSEKVDGALA
jgi:hypothetical protein